jgi:UDP-glucose 4-epimerase
MNLLVVGGAGYIGSHMMKRLLASQNSVTILDDLSTGYRDAVLGGDFIEGDLADRVLLENIFSKNKSYVVCGACGVIYVT